MEKSEDKGYMIIAGIVILLFLSWLIFVEPDDSPSYIPDDYMQNCGPGGTAC